VKYHVNFTLEALEDLFRISTSQAKAALVGSKQLLEILRDNPVEAGKHLSEGLYCIDCDPLRAFYIIDAEKLAVEIVTVKQI
jgi:hypothetical protein